MNIKKYDENKNITEYTIWMLLNLTRNCTYRIRELELAQLGLTVEQSAVLQILARRGGSATAKTIGDITMRQPHSISTLINRMVKMHLLAKKKNPDSKRFEILVTKHGEDLLKKISVHSMEMLFSCLREGDRERLWSYLNILLEKARDLLGLSFVPPFLVKPVEARDDRENNGQKHIEDKKPTEFELWMLLNRTRNSIYRIRELELAQLGLTVEQSAVLQILARRGGSATSRTIGDITMRQPHSISTLINRMVKMRLLAKKKNPDSKSFEILITKQGGHQYTQVPVNSLEAVFSTLKVKERERLRSHLNILLEKARELLGLSFTPPFLMKQPRRIM
jgi:DNA-binding MarR family transcriptional regulator